MTKLYEALESSQLERMRKRKKEEEEEEEKKCRYQTYSRFIPFLRKAHRERQ
jgi:hypothetical protein